MRMGRREGCRSSWRRGAWLMFLDFTVVSMVLNFGRRSSSCSALCDGLSMIGMAALVWIGPRLVLVVGRDCAACARGDPPLLHAPGRCFAAYIYVLRGATGRMGIVLYPLFVVRVMCLGFGYDTYSAFPHRYALGRSR